MRRMTAVVGSALFFVIANESTTLGTPAPVAPPRHLVATGLYRYVRNPMCVSIVAVICGQALIFGDCRHLVYGALFWLACHLFVVE